MATSSLVVPVYLEKPTVLPFSHVLVAVVSVLQKVFRNVHLRCDAPIYILPCDYGKSIYRDSCAFPAVYARPYPIDVKRLHFSVSA